ncbi:HD domain-containing protein [Micromonospora parva]|uniref:HD domain-containing protein n=1 Tax=Micromonospora parva TaxID=1464048 RepID=UPI0033D3ED9F
MTSDALRRALTAPADPPLRPLPEQVVALLETLHAPPRLAAHLRAVHEVAAQLTDAVAVRFPQLPFDREAVLFGAATHDVGKVRHPEELSGPGPAHEPAGYESVFLDLDDILDRIAADADLRLAFQATHPVRG